jgi:two-component system, OmpR family, response regulator
MREVAASRSTASSAPRHVCIVDDDEQIRTLLSDYLSRHGLRVGAFADGSSLRRFLGRTHVDLVILDIMLGAEDGLSICRRLKAETDLPVMMLTARGDEIDRILGLEMGADDYICKPFSPRELLARIRNLLRLTDHRRRQRAGMDVSMLRFHRWRLDTTLRAAISDDGQQLRLTGNEFQLLHAFASNANRILSRSELARLLHGRELEAFDRGIDVLVSRLRQLLGDNARDPRIIRTIYGRGYMLSGSIER